MRSEVMKEDPDNLNAIIVCGIAYARMGKKDESLKTFSQALERSPNDHEIMNNIGSILYERGQYEGAAEQYLKALQAKPEGMFPLGHAT